MSFLIKRLPILTVAIVLVTLAACQAELATPLRADPIAPSSATIDEPQLIYNGGLVREPPGF